jgi:diguanylate cyclase (GGDEF)-like protein
MLASGAEVDYVYCAANVFRVGPRDPMTPPAERTALPHRRTLGAFGVTALALGGSNQSLYLIAVLIIGQGAISGQGTAAVPLLIVGVLLSWAAAPGWTELVLMSPGRVGGIAAACSDAFRPYSLVLSALTGCSYMWGYIPGCALSAFFAASAVHAWVFPSVPTTVLAIAFICMLVGLNLCGIRMVASIAIPIALVSATLAFVAAFVPIVAGAVDWRQAVTFHLTTPFPGWFGNLSSVMAGLYLVGFAAPNLEAATCYVGETIDPARNVPRAMFRTCALAGFYFIVLPVVWLGALGPQALGQDLAVELGPVFAPLVGSGAKAMATGFLIFNMFGDVLQPITGASRTLAQLSEDGICPRFLALRTARDVPWAASLVLAAAAIGFLLLGDPIWLIAAANFTYLLAISLASIAVWLLRRDAPAAERPYRAPPGTITLGLLAASVWAATAIFGFQQFGLTTIQLSLVCAYAGMALFAWRKIEDRLRKGLPGVTQSLHLSLMVAMGAVLLFDGAGYVIAVHAIPAADLPTMALLKDTFVVVALLTIGVGLVLPGMIGTHATRELAVSNATLLRGTQALEQEICERELAEQRLLHLASHDELTGLANRALFTQRFKDVMSRMQRSGDRTVAVLLLDLDGFKLVNDSLGHFAGDQLLVAVAERLKAVLRPGDTFARLAGDEFIILLEDIAFERDVTVCAERVRREVAAPFAISDVDVFVSASIGIAYTRSGFDRPEDVLRNADLAMYRAKELGKDRFEVFAPEFLTEAVLRLQLQNDLKGALERREFVLFYQPIVSLRTEALTGFEALVRWRHPERGLLGPDTFIAVAEESGAILRLGTQVLEEACRQARIWDDAFRFERPLAISVNVSARQLSDSGLLEQMTTALLENGLSSKHVHVEITESAIMKNPEIAMVTLRKLRDLGIEVHLDDFGTGYSSLSYLQRFPVDTLKIDRSFVSMLGDDVSNPEIVQTITSLARSLSIATTAEGIETRAQFEQLLSLGCTNGQGYYISPPVDAATASDMIRAWGLGVAQGALQ